MDDFLKLIATLRERIDSHQVALRRNEALTRSVLIDPLLRALGWDMGNPAHIIPEYPIRSAPKKKADYALFAGSTDPTIIVEAKSLGAALSEAALQALHYCNADGYKYFAVTDGSQWTLYETFREAALDEKSVVRFDLRSDSPVDVCSRAFALWRQRFVDSGSALREPDPLTKAEAERPTSVRQVAPAPVGCDLSSDRDLSSDWVPLSRLAPEGHEKPQELRLPSGETLGVSSWAQLVTKLTKWLLDDGHLNDANLPIRGGKGARYLVAAQPRHSNGNPFTSPAQAGRFFVETSHSGPNHARNMRTILNNVGKLPDEFAVRTLRPDQDDQS